MSNQMQPESDLLGITRRNLANPRIHTPLLPVILAESSVEAEVATVSGSDYDQPVHQLMDKRRIPIDGLC